MTSISSVNSTAGSAASTNVQKSQLSNDTKSKLEALGISATDGMTETEALALIAQAQASQRGQNDGGEQSDNSTESEILSDAKSLAAEVGISVSSNDDISEILDDIGEKLEVMLEEAETNPSVLTNIAALFGELSSLDDRYDSFQSIQDGMFTAMSMVSTSNKIALGLS